MTKTKWTPGPWKVDRYDQPVTVCGQAIPCFEIESGHDSCWIAKVQDHRNCIQTPTGAANAHLISAAPDLYEALREISDALEDARAANPEASIEFFEELVEIEPGWRKRLKDALAKARGEGQ